MNARLLMPLIGTLFIMLGGAPADLVLRNGKIVTVDERYGTVQAIAVRADRILAVGTNEEIAEHIGPQTKVIDLQGKFASPGFIEGHGHFTSMGSAMLNLDLMRVANWDEVIAMVEGAVKRAKPGEWIIGRGWHQEKWDKIPRPNVEGFPTHDALSAVSPDNPVCLTHASGHACFFNAKAMDLAGIDPDTPDPLGGEILHDESGQPIGIFRETAQGLVSRVHRQQMDQSPAAVEARLRKAIRLADRECLAKGITSFQDAGSSFTTIDVMKKMALAGEIGTRLWVMIRSSNESLRQRLAQYRMVGTANHHLTVRAIKRSMDGA
ncbi:MAG: amidohydrolase family protein, partial [Planctomycetes bacterium]|nr:amidohydrolase family protein [Planctomycetota bacterium]